MTGNARFRDLDLDFMLHPISGDVVTKTDADAVKRSVRNLVLLSRGDKPFHSEISCGIRSLLFEPLGRLTAIRIQQQITNIIRDYEPRALLQDVSVRTDTSQNGYDITITFGIKNVLEPVRVSVALESLR